MAANATWRLMMKDIFTGKLVRLTGLDPEESSKAFSRWNRDSEYRRLLMMAVPPLNSAKAIQKWLEKSIEEVSPTDFFFMIRSLDEDQLLGALGLEIESWAAREAFVFIFIGERENWGKGYGTDAMRIALCYAFTELNLWRVSLGVFDYNPRAIRSYEKVGFRHEGRVRQYLNHEGRRWDILYMGILQEEWRQTQHGDSV
jgi:RimJ/RimL family protein N-acetyltransferase